MSWSDGRELREHRQLGRKLESRWGSPQLGSYGQPALAEYDSDDNIIDVVSEWDTQGLFIYKYFGVFISSCFDVYIHVDWC